MTFSERMKELLDQGVAASGEFAAKAGAKAQDLGERGVLLLEIKQLESQARKLTGRLGAEAYHAFTEQGEAVLSAENEPFRTILADIAAAREAIESREANLKSRKGR